MNKRGLLVLILSLLIISLFARFTLAEIAVTESNPNQVAGDLVGVNPEKIPQSIEDARNKYLKQEWDKIVSNIPGIGKVHTYFKEHPLIFKIIFNSQYSFTPTFLFVFLLWILIVSLIYRGLYLFSTYKWGISLAVAIIGSIIIAQLGLINITANFVYDLIFSKEKWWMRLILEIVVVVCFFVLFKLEGLISNIVRKSKDEDLKADLETKIKASEEFRKNFEEQRTTKNEF